MILYFLRKAYRYKRQVACFLLYLSIVSACPSIVGNCYAFPPDDEINRPIDTDPVDYMSNCIVNTVAGWNSGYLRLDLGTSASEGYGIPYSYTNGAPLLSITYGTDDTDYQSESDWYSQSGQYYNGNSPQPWPPAYLPWPTNAAIEGWGGNTSTDPTSGDRHMLVVDQVHCMLYESWNSVRLSHGYEVSNTAIYNFSLKLPQRPDTWTSADAAGLPIYPLLLKYHEIASGSINHAIRFTALNAQCAFTHPATHFGPSSNSDPYYPPYGSRFRLKANFNITSYSADSQVLLTALKKYGLIFADQGTTAFISGMSDPGFSTMISEINFGGSRISFDNFEMVQSPFPIVRCYTPGSLACGALSNNTSDFVPNFTPNCSSNFTPVYFQITESPSFAIRERVLFYLVAGLLCMLRCL